MYLLNKSVKFEPKAALKHFDRLIFGIHRDKKDKQKKYEKKHEKDRLTSLFTNIFYAFFS